MVRSWFEGDGQSVGRAIATIAGCDSTLPVTRPSRLNGGADLQYESGHANFARVAAVRSRTTPSVDLMPAGGAFGDAELGPPWSKRELGVLTLSVITPILRHVAGTGLKPGGQTDMSAIEST